MLGSKPISPSPGGPISNPAGREPARSAPATIEDLSARKLTPPAAGQGGPTAPAPPSQRLDGGAGAVSPIGRVESVGVDVSDFEAGAGLEVGKEVGSWSGRLTGRDRELVGHLGLVRYLRTNQIAELVFRGRAQSVVSGRLGELSERHGNCRALLKRLWFVNGEGRRVQVWALTPSGYALAEEVLGRALKVPRHDVASQFLEHATGVNELYVALVKRQDVPPTATARRGKPADDFARLPAAFRWIPSEELELPFSEYVREEGRARDRRLQPDAVLEDLARKRRYLIEYETGTATVRNVQHKTATLTKLARYSQFILGYAEAHSRSTYYSKHFTDNFTPVVLFIARTVARRDTIAEAVAGWARGEIDARFQVRALNIDEACAEFRATFLGEKPSIKAQAAAAAPVASPPRASAAGVLLSWGELELLGRVQGESLHTIQRVRHAVRARQPVASEPTYPEQTAEAERLLQWLLTLKPTP
jgi:Replication-relaxation